MRLSSQGLDLIKRFEGFSPEPYLCPAGKWTVGYGHVLLTSHQSPVTKEEAEALLKKDVQNAQQAIKRLVSVPLTQGQFDALVSLIYNIGAGAFTRSTLLRKLNEKDVAGAGAQFSRWVFAGGRKLEGLARRREAERAMFLG